MKKIISSPHIIIMLCSLHTIQFSAMEKSSCPQPSTKKISFLNKTDQYLVVYFKDVLPILFNQTLPQEKLDKIPLEIRKTSKQHSHPKYNLPTKKLEPIVISPALQKNFYSLGKTVPPINTWQTIELCSITNKSSHEDLQYSSHFYISDLTKKHNSDELAITESAPSYHIFLEASKLVVEKMKQQNL